MDTYNAAKADYLEAAKKNPDQRWLKIEDRSVEGKPRIVGGGAYTVIQKAAGEDARPLSGPGSGIDHHDSALPDVKLPGLGYAPGSERNVLMRQLYSQMWSWHPRIMTDRPHLYGQALWVIPEYRRQGGAEAVMDFFLAQADSLSLECYLEGSELGTPLYLQKGFVLLERPVMSFRYYPSEDQKDSPSDEWNRLVRGLHAEAVAIMWRPVRGEYEEGKTVLPWVGRPRLAKL
ncbi:hypothetical protein INS49_009344 [Diaporthe citri]|uniref:uncharacterized protein n=1 Tax=Diaporthe citri TaxID=83186 RepID=UPI001C7EBEBE|nr:uncharacterized protein INS49_009344 [Diaporthe citri]KAG6361120.1 hypothetical protein INS49_009344 [Diaporthe citri]